MKKIFFLIACICLPISVWAQTPLADVANSMQPGTWAKVDTNGLTHDMIYPGFSVGGISYALNGAWDSVRHVGYMWSGAHASDAVCNPTPPAVFDPVACADVSQRFLKYDAVTNTWSLQLDAVTGKPHNGVSGPSGLHPYQTLAVDPATGDVYRLWWGNAIFRYSITTHIWTKLADVADFDRSNIPGFAWYPEANGAVLMAGSYGNVAFWNKATNTWSNVITGKTFGYTEPIAIYNPVLHNMLVGSGAGADFAADRTFYILTYGGGAWSLSAPRQIPIRTLCGTDSPFIFDGGGALGYPSIDPVSGKYIVLLRSATCSVIMYEYDSQSDVWTQLPGVPPEIIQLVGVGNPTNATGSSMEVVPIPEYGVIAYLIQTSPATTQAEFWLYRHGGNVSPPVNMAPISQAGPDQIITLPAPVLLSGSASDDGLPAGSTLTYSWSGSGIVFANPAAASTMASFAAAGSYIATLTVSDGLLSGSDSVQITVQSAPSATDIIPPSSPSNVHVTATSGNSIELTWNAATDNVGVVGYKIFSGNIQIGTSTHLVFLATNLSPQTSYSFTVIAYDAAANQSVSSVPVMATTDLLLAFSQKCALSGVLTCDGFDQQAELRYYWPSASYTGSDWWAEDICDKELGPAGKNYTRYAYMDPQVEPHGNTEATVQNGKCLYPFIDTITKHSGSGSIKFPVPTHSGASDGEFYGVFKKYPDGTFGYVGPETSIPTASARHEGDELWVQWYQMVDAGMLNTPFKSFLYSQNWQTASAGATTATVYQCTSAWPLGANVPDAAIGQTIWFTAGKNFIVRQPFTIVGVTPDRCGVILNASPTPSGQGGEYPYFGSGYISGGRNALGWKSMGVFGNPPNTTCCGPATQILVNNAQMGLPNVYSYGTGTVAYGTSDYVQPTRGCVFHYPADFDNGTFYKEPPCVRFHSNQWQEFTVHIKVQGDGSNCPSNGIYQMWVDGQLTWDLQNFTLCWGTNGSANGLGQFNLSPYHTGKDPNQDHPDTAIWFDDLVISTRPIPMGAAADGPVVPPTPDPCIVDPLKITNVKWPAAQTGTRSLTYNSGSKLVASLLFTWPGTLTVTDTRNCKATVYK